jgi:5'-methylthioadenosine phosphorylase
VSGSRLAIAEGHGVLAGALAADAELVTVEVPGGHVTVLDAGAFVLVPRHGMRDDVPPHLVDHLANVHAALASGCDRMLALSSTGGLRRELAVGSLLAPDDVIALGVESPLAGVPAFSAEWRREVLAAWARAPAAPPLGDGGVYWQTRGPRFETSAEIRVLAAYADVVGMTVASELFAAQHLGIAYAAICVVDNLANGVGDAPLTVDEYVEGTRATHVPVVAGFRGLLSELSA